MELNTNRHLEKFVTYEVVICEVLLYTKLPIKIEGYEVLEPKPIEPENTEIVLESGKK